MLSLKESRGLELNSVFARRLVADWQTTIGAGYGRAINLATASGALRLRDGRNFTAAAWR